MAPPAFSCPVSSIAPITSPPRRPRRAACSRPSAANRRTTLIAAEVSQLAWFSSRCVRSGVRSRPCRAILHPFTLGSSLTSTLYVLDEPSIGLHPRDAGRLAGVLRRLAGAGNAVVVVEHAPALIGRADHVIDLGPGPGKQGGEVVYQGSLRGLLEAPRPSASGNIMKV